MALLVASTSSLGCMSASSGPDGGKARAGMTTMVHDGGSDDAGDGRALDARPDVVGRTGPDRPDGGAGDLVVDVTSGGDGAVDASADAADAIDADSDAVDANAGPSACVLGASSLGACVLP